MGPRLLCLSKGILHEMGIIRVPRWSEIHPRLLSPDSPNPQLGHTGGVGKHASSILT